MGHRYNGVRLVHFKNKKNLEKIIGLVPFRNRETDERYIPFCDNHIHIGYIKYPRKCERIRCRHYLKLYLNGHCYLDENTKNYKKEKKSGTHYPSKGC